MTHPDRAPARFTARTLLVLLIPVLLLAAVIALFLSGAAAPGLQSAAPIESLTLERYVLLPGAIELHVRNSGHQPITIAQVIVNDAVMPFEVQPRAEVGRLGRATVHISYPWTLGEAYAVRVFSGNAIPFEVQIPVAFQTAQPTHRTFLGFTMIGVYVGVIPVFLGILWFPALRQLGRKTMLFLLAATAGLLVFLGLDTLVEALESAAEMPAAFQGVGLIGIGSVATFLLLEAIADRGPDGNQAEAARRSAVAMTIAIGIGLHNLGEGLAIGAAYNVGEISLGAFLVVGFIIQNITEGLGIIAPVLRDRPTIGRLAAMGAIAGVPAILGAWIGGFAPSPLFATLFLAVGTGAIFQVVYSIAKLMRSDTGPRSMPVTAWAGVLTGMAVLWLTGLWIK
jgi:zinc transporter ZupT